MTIDEIATNEIGATRETRSGKSSLRSVLRDGSKRGLDILAAGLGLVFLAPLFLFIGILIKRDSPGPVFFKCKRVGQHGRLFDIFKFRTMAECDASYAGARITVWGDARVTKVGKWLRSSKLNELPQLWNVLRGDMSLVGPRPEDPTIVDRWPAGASQEILSVRPGVTSQASVMYRDEEKLLKAHNVMDEYLKTILPDKLRLDVLYVRNRNLLSDLDVIFWTLFVLFPGREQKPLAENMLFAGPVLNLARRYVPWFVVDTLVALIATGLVGTIWRLNGPLNLGFSVSLGLAAGIAFLFGIINAIIGVRQVSWRNAGPGHVLELAFSSGVTTLLVYVANHYWRPASFFPRGMVIVIGVFAFLGFVAVRYRQRLITGLAFRWTQVRGEAGSLGERVLIVGAGACGQLATWLLHKSDLSSAFSVIGMVDDDPLLYNLRVDGYQVLGSTRDIPRLVEQKNIGVVMYAISKIDPLEQQRILNICRSVPARVVVIPDLIQIMKDQLLNSTLEDAHASSVV